MKKGFLKSAVAGLLTLAVVGTSVALPNKAVISANAATNYEKDHEYETYTLKVNEEKTYYFDWDSLNSSSAYVYDVATGTYVLNTNPSFGICFDGEDKTANSDYIATPMDRNSYIDAYAAYQQSQGDTYYDAEWAAERKASSYAFEMYWSNYDTNEYFRYSSTFIGKAADGTPNYLYAYWKVAKNPNITYTVGSNSAAVTAEADASDASRVKVKAVGATNGSVATVTLTRTNAATGKSKTKYIYVDVKAASLSYTKITESKLAFYSVKNGVPYSNYNIASWVNDKADDATYTLTSSNEAVARISTNEDMVPGASLPYNTYRKKMGSEDIEDGDAIKDAAGNIVGVNGMRVDLIAAGSAVLTVTETYATGVQRLVGTIKVLVKKDGTTTYSTVRKMSIGESFNLFDFYLSAGGSENNASFSINKLTKKQKKVLSVSTSTGLVTAKKAGTVTLKVKMNYNDGINNVNSVVQTYKIIVKKPYIASGAKDITLTAKDKNPYVLGVEYRKVGATYTFSSSNKKLATVDKQGAITAKKPGDVVITVKEKVKNKKKTKVTELGKVNVHIVPKQKDDLIFNGSLYGNQNGKASKNALMSVNKGVKFDLYDYIYASSASDGRTKMTFKSSKKGVATVNKNTGIVTAKKNGTTTITANAGGIKAKLTLKVVSPKTTTANDVASNKAAASLSKLVGQTKSVTKLKQATALYKKYLAAYNLYNDKVEINGDKISTGTDVSSSIKMEDNNYIAVPNASALYNAEDILDRYFTAVGADYDKAENFKVGAINAQTKTATVTFTNNLTKVDVLKYCYDKKEGYSDKKTVEYSGTADAGNCKYVTIPSWNTGSHRVKVVTDPATGETDTVYVYDMYAVNAAGQYVTREYKDYNYDTYQYESVKEKVIESVKTNIGGSATNVHLYRKAGSKKGTLKLAESIDIYNAYGKKVYATTDSAYADEASTRKEMADLSASYNLGLNIPAENVVNTLSPASVKVKVTLRVNGTKIGSASTTYSR